MNSENHKSKMLERVSKMPRLHHSIVNDDGTKSFDIMDSEVVDWLCEQQEVRQFLFEKVRQMSGEKWRLGAIVYDETDNTWRGVDTK